MEFIAENSSGWRESAEMKLAKKHVIKEHIRIAIGGILAKESPFDTFLHCCIANEMLYERRYFSG